MNEIETKIQALADRTGVSFADMRFCLGWFHTQVGDFINAENADEVVAAYMPEFAKAADRLGVQAHSHPKQMENLLLDLMSHQELVG